MSIELREFGAADYQRVRSLWEATEGVGLGDGDSLSGVVRLLNRNPGLSWVALSGDELAGAILCGHDGRRGWIYHLTVSASFRRCGLGTKLVNCALRGLHDAGIEQCYAFAFQANAVAKSFWRTLGAVARDDLVPFRIDTRS